MRRRERALIIANAVMAVFNMAIWVWLGSLLNLSACLLSASAALWYTQVWRRP